jgi:hypothetical protein
MVAELLLLARQLLLLRQLVLYWVYSLSVLCSFDSKKLLRDLQVHYEE